MTFGAMVSIIIPCLNREAFLFDTLDSISKQNYQNFECLVVDDGSSDNSHDVFKEFSDDRSGKWRWIDRSEIASSSGAPLCRNIGARHSEGDYLLFLDSDDQLAPNCLFDRVKAIESGASLDFVVGRCGKFVKIPGDCVSEIWGASNKCNSPLENFLGMGEIPWQTASPLWRRSFLVERELFWDESIRRGQDHEFHVRALLKKPKFIELQSVDHYWRKPEYNQAMSGFYSLKNSFRDGERLWTIIRIIDAISESDYLIDTHRGRLIGLRQLVIKELRDSCHFGYKGKLVDECLSRMKNLQLIKTGHFILLFALSRLNISIGNYNLQLFLFNKLLRRNHFEV